MTPGCSRTVARLAALLGLTTVLGACGGGGGGGSTAPLPGVPLISNLAGAFSSQRCTVSRGQGTTLIASFDYTDSDGDVRGGTVQTTGSFLPAGDAFDVNFGVPSSSATITGTTEGTIRISACARFGASTQLKLDVALLDTASHSSNILSVTVDRPAGAPEQPRGQGSGDSFQNPLGR